MKTKKIVSVVVIAVVLAVIILAIRGCNKQQVEVVPEPVPVEITE